MARFTFTEAARLDDAMTNWANVAGSAAVTRVRSSRLRPIPTEWCFSRNSACHSLNRYEDLASLHAVQDHRIGKAEARADIDVTAVVAFK